MIKKKILNSGKYLSLNFNFGANLDTDISICTGNFKTSSEGFTFVTVLGVVCKLKIVQNKFSCKETCNVSWDNTIFKRDFLIFCTKCSARPLAVYTPTAGGEYI